MLLFFKEKRAEGTPSTVCSNDVSQNELKNQHDLPEKTKSIFYFNDCESMPVYENQEGVYRDLEMFKEFWGIDKTAESPQSSTVISKQCTTNNDPYYRKQRFGYLAN